MSIFKTLFKSLYFYSEYKDLIKISKFKTYLYIVLLSFISIIPFFLPTSRVIKEFKETLSSIVENIEIDVENGKLYIVEEDYYLQSNNGTILVISNSDDSLEYYLSSYYGYGNDLVIITPGSVYVRNNGKEAIYSMGFFLDYFGIYSKEDIQYIQNYFEVIFYVGISIGFLIFLTLIQLFIAIGSLIISPIAKGLFFKKEDGISFGDSFKILVLANTFPVFISLILPNLSILIRVSIIIIIYAIVAQEIKKSSVEC